MSWDSGGPERSPDELLALVRAKANRVRWRRRLGVTSSAVALVATMVLAAVALAGPQGAARTQVATLGHGSTSTRGPLPGSPAGAAVTVAPPATPSTPSTTAWAPPPTTPSGASPTRPRVAPTLPPATTTTTAPQSVTTVAPTTTTTAPWPPVCAAPFLQAVATADGSSYPPGQVVNIALSIQNRGTVTCMLNRDPGMAIRDATGKSVQSEGVADLCTFFSRPGPPTCVLAPGQSQQFNGLSWTHTGCVPGTAPCAPGTYTADVSWGEITAAPLRIVLS